MDSEVDQALLQPHEEDNLESRQGIQIDQIILNLNHFKSFETVRLALKMLTSKTKYVFLMILSMVPFFAFMVFYEIKIHKSLNFISNFLISPSSFLAMDHLGNITYHDTTDRSLSYIFLKICPFDLVVCPVLELFGLTIIVKIAAKIYARDKETTLKQTINEIFYQKNNFKGPFITSLWVQLLSTSTLVGLFWIVANHFIIIISNGYYDYFFIRPIENYVNILSMGFHAMIFVALFYKYLDWSALWNMGIVISVLEEEIGIDALEMSFYYGKHYKKTGFELMLVFFAWGVLVRLPLLMLGTYNDSVGGILVISIVVGLVCLGNLAKWVALMLYFYDCKAQTLLKKVDEEVGKTSDIC